MRTSCDAMLRRGAAPRFHVGAEDHCAPCVSQRNANAPPFRNHGSPAQQAQLQLDINSTIRHAINRLRCDSRRMDSSSRFSSSSLAKSPNRAADSNSVRPAASPPARRQPLEAHSRGHRDLREVADTRRRPVSLLPLRHRAPPHPHQRRELRLRKPRPSPALTHLHRGRLHRGGLQREPARLRNGHRRMGPASAVRRRRRARVRAGADGVGRSACSARCGWCAGRWWQRRRYDGPRSVNRLGATPRPLRRRCFCNGMDSPLAEASRCQRG